MGFFLFFFNGIHMDNHLFEILLFEIGCVEGNELDSLFFFIEIL